jgi:hypothetical protein
METSDQILARFNAELAVLSALDRDYYRKPNPSVEERGKYHKRQEERENIRARFYRELEASLLASGTHGKKVLIWTKVFWFSVDGPL